MNNRNSLLVRTALKENTERTPVWLMRQAGRVLPEYRKLRDSVDDFKKLVCSPELAAEVTLQPVHALGVDAAIIFSDILVIPEAMGLPYEMKEGSGPHFPRYITTSKDIEGLHVAETESLSFVSQAITIVKRELDGKTPLIGFAGAPWTIFAYMTEGAGSKTFSKAKRWLYSNATESHKLLSLITESTITYLKSQVLAGVDIIQLFDSWAGLLGPSQYRDFSLPYIRRICDALDGVPKIVFPKGAYYACKDLAATNCEIVGLDWTMDIEGSGKLMPGKVLQGNLDPCALYGTRDQIIIDTKKMLDQFVGLPHIANLGHGLYPDTDVDSVKCFIDTVKEYSTRNRRSV